MGLFSKIFGGESERKSLAALEALLTEGARTATGVVTTPTTAMKCPAVHAAVRIRVETLSNLSLKLFQRDGDEKRPATDHPLHDLIHSWANPFTPAGKLIRDMEFDCIAQGSGYAIAVRAGGKIMELHRLKPDTVSVEYSDDLEPLYVVAQKGGGAKTYPWSDVLHVSSLNGLSPIKECAEAIGLCMAAERHLARILGNGARPSGVIKLKNALKSDAFKRLRDSWRSAHSGDGAGSTAILEDGAEFQALTFSSVDLQFAEARAFQILEIGRAMGTPPNLLFDFTRQTYSNSEDASQSFLSHTILGRCKAWQDAIGRLLSEEERANYFAEFSTDSLVKADIAQRYSAYAQAIACRILNPNEVRAYENLPPYAGGEQYVNPNVTTPIPPPIQRDKPRAVAA